MLGGQEAAAPEAGENRLVRIFPGALGNEDHVGRQVLILAAEAVADPGAHAEAFPDCCEPVLMKVMPGRG